MLKFICLSLLIMCNLTHPFHRIEYLLTGRTCNLAHLSWWIADRYDVKGVWRKIPAVKRYYEDYPY